VLFAHTSLQKDYFYPLVAQPWGSFCSNYFYNICKAFLNQLFLVRLLSPNQKPEVYPVLDLRLFVNLVKSSFNFAESNADGIID
tara:strand:+ start:1371 stop:1622 length:252 start_codon:yes stop_codon:yes gene_type:complete